jgi:hypothetical protein
MKENRQERLDAGATAINQAFMKARLKASSP